MNTMLTTLTLDDFILYGSIGAILSVIYLFLIWQTVCFLSRSRKKGLALFLSSVLRIFLLIFVALACSKQNIGYFLIIMCFFLLTRTLLLKLFSPSLKKKLKNSEIPSQDKKRTQLQLTKTRTRRRRRY